MKKLVAVVLALVLVLSVASAAMAVPFHIVTDSTSIFKVGTAKFARKSNSWYVSYDLSASNVAPDHRAVARVHKGVDAASATWVYEGVSSSPHPYYSNAVVDQVTLDFRGRLDNTASGLLEFHGNFQN